MSVTHIFQPIVNVTELPNGGFDVSVDWSDSYQGGMTPDGLWPDQDAEGHARATAAVDEWVKTRPQRFTIAGAREQV